MIRRPSPRLVIAIAAALASCSALLTFSAPPATAVSSDESFCDIDAADFFSNAVNWAAETGITRGTGPRLFSPQRLISRAEMATFLHRFVTWRDGQASPGNLAASFDDVEPNSFAATPVAWAASHGITTGVAPGRFEPNATTTRAQVATFLYREAGAPSPAGPSTFYDVPADGWFTEPVAWMSEVGATTGTTKTTFEPSAPVTRAEAVTFLWRLVGEPASPVRDDSGCGGRFHAVGDSVMGSARLRRGLSADGFPGWTGDIDDRTCRLATRSILHAICGETSVPSTLSTLQAWRAEGVLDDAVFIHVGANGRYDEGELDQLIDTADADIVWIITVSAPRSWVEDLNAMIAESPERWAGRRDVRVLDWAALVATSPSWLVKDGVHVNDAGAIRYAAMIAAALADS